MRYAIPIVVLFAALAVITGCGPANTEPKVINVKEDPRLQRTIEGKKNENQPPAP